MAQFFCYIFMFNFKCSVHLSTSIRWTHDSEIKHLFIAQPSVQGPQLDVVRGRTSAPMTVCPCTSSWQRLTGCWVHRYSLVLV